MLLSPCLNGEMPVESILAGGNGNGSIQLRPENSGASSWAADSQQQWRGGLATVMDSKFCDFRIHSYSYSASYSVIIRPIFN